MSFSKDFVWGVSTAAYQIEGAAYEDDKGLSVWDVFCRRPGAIHENQTGNVACDHYHRYKEDVAIMKEIGIRAYRMSLSWPRIIPEGTGKVNAKGLMFYDKIIDELLSNGITPYITLFHWDHPYELYCRGGWLNPESSNWFAEYTRVVIERFSDRVKNWMTFNEPQCFIGFGHQDGTHAPGDKLALAQVLRAGHNVLLAHGKAVQTIRSYSKSKCQVGYAPVGFTFVPETDKPEDVEAARAATFGISEKNCMNNTWWIDPVFTGQYPEDGLKLFGDDAPKFTDADMTTIKQPLDFLGINIYSGRKVCADKNGTTREIIQTPGGPMTSTDGTVVPKSLYWGPKFFFERYKKPILITENGMPNLDWISLDGKVHDPQRIDFLHRYLLELWQAAKEGVKINGYFQWSLMDNFEWAVGYKRRFGIVHVDYVSQARTLKDSAYWYKDVITTNGKAFEKAPANWAKLRENF
jgi:beta-glucosidase